MQQQSMFVLVLFLGLLTTSVTAQNKPDRPGRGDGGERSERGAKSDDKDGIKPYDEVITEEHTTTSGLFLVHRAKNDVLFEIPRDALGTDMLWVTQLEKTQAGFGYGGTGLGKRVVRWEMRGEDILLRDIKYTIRGDEGDSIRHAVEGTSLAPIIDVFPIKAWGKDQAPVIDVTDLFTGDVQEFSAKRRLDASGVDAKRTFVESVQAFPENIETKVLMTYRLSSSRESSTPPTPRRGRPTTRRDRSQSAVTVLLHHSMVKLPARPMTPREHDDRVGFFSKSFENYDGVDHEVETIRYITRWRLEKKDPTAAVSEPVKPIVFYVGRGVPEKWRPWVHQGIEMWQPAFEAAGFANAILAKDPPGPREDPAWDAEDARYSTIRWLPSTTENAMGPHVSDPRTGEILEADILVYHNVIKLVRDWYFVQASPNDPRAQKLPMPDELIGEALAYVIAHEVGHSLGFPHNMKASSAFTVAQLRDAEFTAKNGTEASIMDYGRFNYVAQPGDGAQLIPKIGPYDFFAVEWGYRQYASPEEESESQATLVARQIDDPVLRFGDPNPAEDPSQQTEDLGSDSILATELGLQNIDRIADYLVEACCTEGENYDLLRNMYDRLLGQRNRELGHVVNVVGGFVRTNLWYGDAERVYEPVPAARQREAVSFLIEHAFQAPASLIRDDILRRLESNGAPDRILGGQRRILDRLLDDDRIKRMAEHANGAEGEVYLPVDMMQDVSGGIWTELGPSSSGTIDLYRRNLQRAHVEVLAARLTDEDAGASDLPGLARGELQRILGGINTAFRSQGFDETSALHLTDIQARVREHLNPLLERGRTDGAFASPASAPRGGGR